MGEKVRYKTQAQIDEGQQAGVAGGVAFDKCKMSSWGNYIKQGLRITARIWSEEHMWNRTLRFQGVRWR